MNCRGHFKKSCNSNRNWISYPQKLSIPLLLTAQQKAVALSSESGYISKDTVGIVFPRAQSRAMTVGNEAKKKGIRTSLIFSNLKNILLKHWMFLIFSGIFCFDNNY